MGKKRKISKKKTHIKDSFKKAEKEVGKITNEMVKTINIPFTQDKRKLTFGQRAADFIAKWAGSWVFILSFFVFIILWMATNVYMWLNQWDAYPFILLNLVLSCLAAVQAPVI